MASFFDYKAVDPMGQKAPFKKPQLQLPTKSVIEPINSKIHIMTTLTIEIPDSEKAIVSDFVKQRGGNILNIDSDDDLTEKEFALLQESYKEALLIKKGLIKALPLSELWND